MSIGARIGSRIGARIGARPGASVNNVVIPTWAITKTGGVDGTYDGGASSVETIAGNGYVEITVDSTAVERTFGLSILDPDVNFNTILNGFVMTNAASLYRVESGVFTLLGPYAVSDVLRVAVVGANALYIQNGVTLATVALVGAGARRIDTAMANTNSKLAGIKFYDAGVQKAVTWQNAANVTITNP